MECMHTINHILKKYKYWQHCNQTNWLSLPLMNWNKMSSPSIIIETELLNSYSELCSILAHFNAILGVISIYFCWWFIEWQLSPYFLLELRYFARNLFINILVKSEALSQSGVRKVLWVKKSIEHRYTVTCVRGFDVNKPAVIVRCSFSLTQITRKSFGFSCFFFA